MLTISSNGTTRNCEGIQRRDFLTIGALSVGGLTLSQLFALKALAGPVLSHRIFLKGGGDAADLLDGIVSSVSVAL